MKNITPPDADPMAALIKQMLPGSIEEAGGDPTDSITFEAKEDEGADGPMEDTVVLAILDENENIARGFVQDKISRRAADANRYYLAQATDDLAPPESEGRSDYVDSSVADTLNWMLPSLMEVFGGGGDVCEFVARKPQHCDAAEQTTAMVNYVYEQNEGWTTSRTWIQDALMNPAGILKIYWEENTVQETTEYRALTDMQFAMIEMDPTLVVLKHRIYHDPSFQRQQAAQMLMSGQTNGLPPAQQPPAPMGAPVGQAGPPPQGMPPGPQMAPPAPAQPTQLHDVVVHNMTDQKVGSVKIVNVPLEEFYVSPESRKVEDGYSAHVVRRTMGELVAMGYDEELISQCESMQYDPSMSETAIVRESLQDTFAGNGALVYSADASQREVLLVEAYLKMDYLQTGIPQWRKITRVGDVILENKPTDGPPFILLLSNPLSHELFGIGSAEHAMTAQRNNTSIWRSVIDSISLSANSQLAVIEDNVNISDLLDQRPGGIVRVKDMNSVAPLQQGSGDLQGAVQLLGLLDTAKQERTGVMKLTQGSDADILNQTASGNQAMTDRANQRIKMMARHFAESGFKKLARRIQLLLAKYQDQFMTIRINGEWVDVDPTAAMNHYDMIVRVGLGTGDKSKEVAELQTLLGIQEQVAANPNSGGMVTAENIHKTLIKLAKAMGETAPQEAFNPPQPPAPPAPPPPDPMLIKIQADHAATMAEIQARSAKDTANIQAQMQADIAKHKMDQELEREKFFANLAMQREEMLLKYGITPAEEQQDFNSIYQSTTKVVTDDELLQAIIAAPEPFGGQDPNMPTSGIAPSQAAPSAPPVQAGPSMPGANQ